ncbi:MAG: hypothetical protein HOE90_11360 [Bacteriovoracaceae bacterium]|jgi:hypothetical protein|nr:hypothetical protein [Bacteriovoracaceae bacterium]
MKILLGSYAPGGAECLIHIAQKLLSLDHQISTLTTNMSAQIFLNHGITPDYEFNCIGVPLYKEVEDILKKIAPDVVVSGIVGPKDQLDYALIEGAKELKIPILSILDSWMNYADRFNNPVTLEKNFYQPNLVAVMDQFTLDEMTKEGCNPNICFISGHPKFDWIKKSKEIDNKGMKEKLGLNSQKKCITFFSHPVDSYYPNRSLGYNEFDVFPILFETLFNDLDKDSFEFVFKEHPIDSTLPKDYIKNYQFHYIERCNIDDLMLATDIAISMSSTMLIFSALCTSKVISIQPNLNIEHDNCVLTRAEILPNTQNKIDFLGELKSGLLETGSSAKYEKFFNADGKSCDRIIEKIYSLGDFE